MIGNTFMGRGTGTPFFYYYFFYVLFCRGSDLPAEEERTDEQDVLNTDRTRYRETCVEL